MTRIILIISIIIAICWLIRKLNRLFAEGDDMEKYTGNDKEGWKI